ncbi:MAG: GNAT family N-acetyltransferase [candidate division Zixibacteria bacterium]|nr:GNAT family N-acetyltransferase [candidate division Zixibacteria bacterium]
MAEEKKKKEVFLTTPSLVGKKMYLRTATAEDVVNFQKWRLLGEPQSMSCRMASLITPAQAAERYAKKEAPFDNLELAVVLKKDHILVGKAVSFDYNHLNRSAELGLIIDPDEHEKGYGKEALHLLYKYLFKQRGLYKVYAQTAEFNKPAMKLLESLRFKKDATLRNHYFYDGSFHAGLIYSLLLSEFE